MLVVDDHAAMREGLSAVLNAQPDMIVAGEASDGREAIQQFRKLQPDVSLLDWNLPIIRGEEVLATLGAEFPKARFIVISALLFATGAIGILIRRSPMVILLCLELMLNAGNLALVAFSRMVGNGQGQVFAVIVMVVAACEVVVGLGLIVAIFRRRLPLNVDDLRELRG